MSGDDIDEITTIGTGAMGAQIAMVCAPAGYDVTACDPDANALTRETASEATEFCSTTTSPGA
ncbi:3-hydroxyacyl-CoA dehydrogenase NAD-binding domain-containing protein [Saccharopolyspora sp. TS4A08]|uniref:3-hydroxyacyl-CoA dehydrogenase NAD-binding domain-containing protein n=1 Tax=Saccharopolyspora ipomoeae TaxID=3042027 RepID=A0ABT6PQ58_9PSEU|nr:3-hydroxyacyl-CoA dehydrogenase NAD-binding domain-containing protein [Saccharopolyspora sp. TS4A08]MDI2029576.1 3-hydroxyacyl-CoA dehydrogenase NAD-binding domain-containing protein [Saccharopolyspora sp. TS4A08]